MLPRPDPAAMQAEIDRLADLTLEELKARFLALKGVPLPKFMRRGLMTQAVAHAIREAAFGGLDRESLRLLPESEKQLAVIREFLAQAREREAEEIKKRRG